MFRLSISGMLRFHDVIGSTFQGLIVWWMHSTKGESHAQITEYYLAIPACIRADLRLPLCRNFCFVAAAHHHPRQHYRHAYPLRPAGAANSARQMGQPRLLRAYSLYGAAVCADWRWRDAVLHALERAVWSGGGLLYRQYAGGAGGRELELTPGTRWT